jgi:hypothetical protein
MSVPREAAVAAPLRDGDVLVAGGTTDTAAGPTDTAELFDPATGQFSSAAWGR